MEVAAYLESATIAVSPRLDGTSVPLKVYTYLSSDKPIVATNIIAHRQILEGDMAMLTPPNAKDFAQGILKLLGDSELRSKLASRAKAFVEENYSIDSYQEKLKSVYQSLDPKMHSFLTARTFQENQ